MPQHLQFDKEMPLTVEDFLAAAFSRRPVWTGVSKKTRAEVLEVLRDVDAAELIARPLGRCSGGELQRVLLALALHPAPDLLVLDEPVSGVDQNGLKMFLDTVLRLKETHHMAILLVSHDLRLVREYRRPCGAAGQDRPVSGRAGEGFRHEGIRPVFGAGKGRTHDGRDLPGDGHHPAH